MLPRFASPPVVEVAISVQFSELPEFQLVHFGQFWERIRDGYPRLEHHPPLPSVVELFGTKGAQRASLSLESGFPLGRCWYLSEDGLRLIQIQPDRFVLNWRKLETEAEYPSYDELRGSFLDETRLFLEFVKENQLGEFEPTQCELTYVNHLPSGRGWSTLAEIGNVLALWSGHTSEAFLTAPEDVRLAWQYRFEEKGTPLGRLHVQAQSASRISDGSPILVLQLIGRGAPLGEDIEGVTRFLDKAHEWIVRGFTALTTDRMHKIWERQA